MDMHVFARIGHSSILHLRMIHSLVHSFMHLLIMLSPGVEVYTFPRGCLYESLFWESAAAHSAHVQSV